MLRHLKMEFRRQQANQIEAKQTTHDDNNQELNVVDKSLTNTTTTATTKHRRVRGRRSSKPMMEKKRRARINQCLDILKSYVLNDSNNLIQLGIDASSRENQTEETIAKHILTSSGLINRHRGRKNTNKLEKADILELTVDYVRRLHLQRNELIEMNQHNNNNRLTTTITSPLSLNLQAPYYQKNEAKTNCIGLQANIFPSPSPPPSSASSSPQPLLSITSMNQQQINCCPTNNNNNYLNVLDLSVTKANCLTANNNWQNVKLYPKNGIVHAQTITRNGSIDFRT